MPAVSVIIPTHNRTNCLVQYLRDAIESVLAQTFTDCEIIVVDDGSEDDTQDLLRSYGDRIRVLSHQRQCTAASLNLGATQSTGRFLAFLDDDDRWEPEKLAIQMELLESDSHLGFVGSQARWVDERERPVPPPLGSPAELESFAGLFQHSFIPASTGVIRRDLYDRLRGFDESLRSAHDWDLWLRAARVAPLRLIPKLLATCRLHPPHSRYKEVHQKVADRVQVIRKTAQLAGLGVRTTRSRVAREYYRHALAYEAQGQRGTAGHYFRLALLAWPLVGAGADHRGTAARRFMSLLRPYLRLLGPNRIDPDHDGDVISVPPDRITHKLATRLDWYLRAGDSPPGDWDRRTIRFTDLRLYQSIIQHFRDGLEWRDTIIFRTSYAERFGAGATGEAVRWTRDLDHLARQYRRKVDRLFRDLARNGFMLRYDRQGNCTTEIPHVHIGRSGEILLGRNGNHRLSMAKVLGLGRVYCRVRARHPDWERIRTLVRRHGPDRCWSFVDARLSDHPDLQALLQPAGRTAERSL